MSPLLRLTTVAIAVAVLTVPVAWTRSDPAGDPAVDGGQEKPEQVVPEAPPPRPWQEPSATQPAQRKLSRQELEKRFEEQLTGALLKGTWRTTEPQGAAGLAALGEAHDDQYTIATVTREEGDTWLFRARIQFSGRDVTLPVRLQVFWAGDTPVITADDVGFPGLGVYSARVMVYGDFYSGVWNGRDHGGVLSGQILRAEHAEPAKEDVDSDAP